MSRDNGCDFGAAIGPPAIINEDADRLVELADAFDPLVELQFGVERGLEEAFTDLVVAETRPFGRAPSADVDILSRHSAADQRADSDGCQGESDDRYTTFRDAWTLPDVRLGMFPKLVVTTANMTGDNI